MPARLLGLQCHKVSTKYRWTERADGVGLQLTGEGAISPGSTSTTIVFGLCENGPGYHFPWTPMTFTVSISNPVGAMITTDGDTGTGTITIS